MKLAQIITGFCFVVVLWINPSDAQNVVQPQPYGRLRQMKEFIKEELVYPDKALNDKVNGTVVVSSTVNPDGSAENFRVTSPVSSELDSEALRICKLILWYPATDIGRPVTCRHSLEIRFDAKKYKSIVKSRGYNAISYPFQPVDSVLKVYLPEQVNKAPQPVFTSRDCNLGNFISRNLQYPEAAFKQNISGKVRLRFVVEPSGRISNLVTENAVGGGCTEEAIRVVKLIRWYPGIKNEMAVRTWRTLEITFDIALKSVSGTIPDPGQIH